MPCWRIKNRYPRLSHLSFITLLLSFISCIIICTVTGSTAEQRIQAHARALFSQSYFYTLLVVKDENLCGDWQFGCLSDNELNNCLGFHEAQLRFAFIGYLSAKKKIIESLGRRRNSRKLFAVCYNAQKKNWNFFISILAIDISTDFFTNLLYVHKLFSHYFHKDSMESRILFGEELEGGYDARWFFAGP